MPAIRYLADTSVLLDFFGRRKKRPKATCWSMRCVLAR